MLLTHIRPFVPRGKYENLLGYVYSHKHNPNKLSPNNCCAVINCYVYGYKHNVYHNTTKHTYPYGCASNTHTCVCVLASERYVRSAMP